jgi:hypothetical protein
MDNTETLATPDTQVTEGRQRKRKNVTQKTKMMIHIPSKAWGVNCHDRALLFTVYYHSFYKYEYEYFRKNNQRPIKTMPVK